jgi:hypothetical protein
MDLLLLSTYGVVNKHITENGKTAAETKIPRWLLFNQQPIFSQEIRLFYPKFFGPVFLHKSNHFCAPSVQDRKIENWVQFTKH